MFAAVEGEAGEIGAFGESGIVEDCLMCWGGCLGDGEYILLFERNLAS